MIHLQFLTAPGCKECERAAKILGEIKNETPALQIEKINVTGEKGIQLVIKHQIIANPAIIINGKLFGAGRVNREELRKEIEAQNKIKENP